jgi:hypothetical protein
MAAEIGPDERALAAPSRPALEALAAARDSPRPLVDLTALTCARMLDPATPRLARIYRHQIERDRWPDFAAFDHDRYPLDLRRDAACHWARRAVAEYGSVHQFSALTRALCEARIGLELLGPLARLLTDELRHAELCARMALVIDPEGPTASPREFAWPAPLAPWPDAPSGDRDAILTWAAGVILIACCLGETLSRPLYDALIVVCSDPVAEAVLRQIQRDEHLHAAFGWDALATLWPALAPAGRAALQERLRLALGGFEATTACGLTIDMIAGSELEITRGEAPNLGTLEAHHYAVIFFSTVERELFPALRAIGLDPAAAWAARPLARRTMSKEPESTQTAS